MKHTLQRMVYYLLSIAWAIRHKGKRKTILFYPDLPRSEGYVMSKMLRLLRLRVTNNPAAAFDIAFHWKDATFIPAPKKLQEIALQREVLNIHCSDISKINVERKFNEVFGYSSFVDPTSFTGKAAAKSNLNSRHDLTSVVHCPLPFSQVDNELIYQRLINNEYDGKLVVIRVMVFRNCIPFINVNYKHTDEPFRTRRFFSKLVAPRSQFSEVEMELILEFCSQMGLDYAELDIVRDTHDGLIYIVDANNTPTGPASELSFWESMQCLWKLMDAFDASYLTHPSVIIPKLDESIAA